MKMTTLAVICPVYMEEEIIERFYENLKHILNTLPEEYESKIIFVVDHSKDNTLKTLKRIAAADKKTQILALSSRFGHQMSLLAGIDHADADAVVMMDSDLQHPPELIPRMLEYFEQGYEIVYTLREEGDETNWKQRMGSKFFYRMINWVSKVPIIENAADFRLVSRKVAAVFKTQLRERNQFMRGLFSWVGFRRIGIPFQVGTRSAGRSKYSLHKRMQLAVHGIVSFSKRPLQAAVLVGLAFAFLGFIFALVTFIQYFIYDSLPSGWTTLAILISVFSGIQLIFLGIIGEYIGAIFDEVKARPHYLIEEKWNFDDSKLDPYDPPSS
jgi:polyisoprenyl-phosphate glycosyltransferase